jgi:hypothetical protein
MKFKCVLCSITTWKDAVVVITACDEFFLMIMKPEAYADMTFRSRMVTALSVDTHMLDLSVWGIGH